MAVARTSSVSCSSAYSVWLVAVPIATTVPRPGTMAVAPLAAAVPATHQRVSRIMSFASSWFCRPWFPSRSRHTRCRMAGSRLRITAAGAWNTGRSCGGRFPTSMRSAYVERGPASRPAVGHTDGCDRHGRTAERRGRRPRPDRRVRPVVPPGGRDRRAAAQRDGAGDGHAGRRAGRPDGAAAPCGRAGLRLLHQLRERQGPRPGGEPAGGRGVLLAPPAPLGARAGARGANRPGGVRGVLGEPAVRQPDLGVGLGAEPTDRRAGGAGGGGGPAGGGAPGGPAAAGLLGRLPDRAGGDRVLAGADQPPARPAPVRAPGRGLAPGASGPVAGGLFCASATIPASSWDRFHEIFAWPLIAPLLTCAIERAFMWERSQSSGTQLWVPIGRSRKERPVAGQGPE